MVSPFLIGAGKSAVGAAARGGGYAAGAGAVRAAPSGARSVGRRFKRKKSYSKPSVRTEVVYRDNYVQSQQKDNSMLLVLGVAGYFVWKKTSETVSDVKDFFTLPDLNLDFKLPDFKLPDWPDWFGGSEVTYATPDWGNPEVEEAYERSTDDNRYGMGTPVNVVVNPVGPDFYQYHHGVPSVPSRPPGFDFFS